MAENNPDITASDIVTDIENNLSNPNISFNIYKEWISYAYQKTFQALLDAGQILKEELFGDVVTIDLTPGVAEYSITSNIPRFGGFIKVEIKYGATGDNWILASRLPSVTAWRISNNNTTQYRGKDAALYYKLGNLLGFIPMPTAGESAQTPQAKVFYVKRPYRITEQDDVIDIPYRFLTPINNYVQAKAIERENEDYGQSGAIMDRFRTDLETIVEAAQAEFDENSGINQVSISTNSEILYNPFNW